jgi:hypothetical protein
MLPRAFLVLFLPLMVGLTACSGDPALAGPFYDGFERAEIGPDYRNTGGPYRIEQGRVVVAGAHNHPLWLRRRLPDDVRIQLDCQSRSPDGDLKVEIAGDGRSFESDDAVKKDLIYTASGYVLIFGGWRNSRSVLVRQNEHAWQQGPGVPQRALPRVEAGRTYHFDITRRGGRVDWKIDGQPFLTFDDPRPLTGKGHDHFGVDGWETEVTFDNLQIDPL